MEDEEREAESSVPVETPPEPVFQASDADAPGQAGRMSTEDEQLLAPAAGDGAAGQAEAGTASIEDEQLLAPAAGDGAAGQAGRASIEIEDEQVPAVAVRPAPQKQARSAPPKGRGGTAGIFAGVAVIAPVLIREVFITSDAFILLPLSLIAVGVALSGFRVAQAGRDGKLGRLGLVLAGVGILLVTVMVMAASYQDLANGAALQSGMGILRFGFILLLVGIVLFGAATLKAGVLSRGPTLMMMLSLPLAVILDAAGAFPGARFRWSLSMAFGQGIHYGLKIFGLSLIWLGYSILKDTRAKSSAAVREA